MAKRTVQMRLDEGLLDDIDGVRGLVSRTAWVEAALRRDLGVRRSDLVEDVSPRGPVVRRSSEAMASAAADREKRAARRAEQVEPIVKGSKK